MSEITRFDEMDIKKEIKKAIAKIGFEEATPIQREVIPQVIAGKDVVGIAQTGTGKTCAFGIPAIEQVDTTNPNIQTLILCPTRELAIQIGEELQALSACDKGVKIVTIYGGQPIERQIIALKKKPQIVIGTPGRVMDHMRRKTIQLEDIRLFVLDEADEMLNMGFREDLDVILEKANGNRQTVLLSATMSKEITKITQKYLKKDAVRVEIEHKTLTAPKIQQYMIKTQEGKKIEILSRILDTEEINLSVIFCNTKRKVEELEDHLKIRGYQVDALHGDMKQSQRDIVMRKFRAGTTNILIATDVAARGIDVDNVEVIFNFDIPTDEEYYVHRIGRTGRAGKEGRAITFVTPKEGYKIGHIEKYTSAKLKNYEVPTAKIVNEKKMNNLLDKVTQTVAQEDLAEEIGIIEQYLENVEMNAIEIAAALLNLKMKKTKAKEIEVVSSDRGGKPRVRLFLTLGKLDGLRRSDLKDFIVEKCHVSKNYIFDTEVLDKFSFVTTNEEAALEIVKSLNDHIYNGRRIAVEISTGKSSGGKKRR